MMQAQIDEGKQYLGEVQSAEIHTNPLQKVTDNLQNELNLGFFSDDNAVAKQTPLIPKKRFDVIVRAITTRRRLKREIFLQMLRITG